ncbi:MAG: hypothetical protein ACI9BH_000800 [Paracoccaceae bacterium]|jgi:hypothetical protein
MGGIYGMGKAMSKTPAKTKKELGVKVWGTAREQKLSLSQDDLLTKIFGVEHTELAKALAYQCLRVLADNEASDDNPTDDSRLFMLEAVAGIKPRDAIESMLAVQMATTHVALIRTGRRFALADTMPQYEAHERAYNKLARTFTAQMEALRKHRNGGNQTVTVQHVNVADGGQAIVGNVQAGGRGNDGK